MGIFLCVVPEFELRALLLAKQALYRLRHSQRFLQNIKYVILKITPNTSLLHPPPLIPGIIFAFAYMCTHYLHSIHLPTPFPGPFTLPTSHPHRQNPFHSPALLFCRGKKIKEKTAAQGISLCCFNAYYVLQPQLVHFL
jgi:hypothetical protein